MSGLFVLKELSKDLKNIDRRCKSLPPILKQQFESLSFHLGRINVRGDGYCGYYVIQLLEYMNCLMIRSLSELLKVREMALQEAKLEEKTKNSLITAKRHYLEYLEFALIMGKLVPKLNIAVIVQSNVKKTGDKKIRRVYPVRIASYDFGKNWAFILLSHNACHYELLTVAEKGMYRSEFTENEAREIFECCQSEYPTAKVDPSDQIVFLDSEDFLYF